MNRRRFLKGAAGAAGAAGLAFFPVASLARASRPESPLLLEARPGIAALLEAQEAKTSIWGYGARVPGPAIRARQGAEVWVRLKNALPQPTTIHWHGIRIENAMDGVAGLTQDAVPPGETFDYRFTVPDAGTFWYHPHNRSWEQLARGLYGPLIVEEASPPDVDRDLILIADDWLLKEDGSLHEESLGSLHDRAHAGRLGNVLTLNGAHLETIPVRAGERIRLRLCNSCNSRILELKLEDVAAHVIARDGQPVEPKPLEDGRLSLAPAQRIDLAVDMMGKPGSRSAIAEVSQGRVVAGIFAYHPSETRKRREELLRLPANQLSEPAADPARKVDLIMTGGAMGGMERALFRGRELPIRELARQHGMVWAFNGVAGMGEKPLFSVRKGESVEMRMVNDTRWPHAIHMHGHHFRQSDAAGGSSAAPWLDTILIARDETATVRFVADNPGKWMIHCHMLEHQAAGMGTWFEVTG